MYFNFSVHLLLMLLLGAACGSSKEKESLPTQTITSDAQVPLPPPGLPSYHSPSQLPVCDVSNEGIMVWVETENSFAVCRQGQYQTVDLRGLPGLNGKDGKDGKPATGNDSSETSNNLIVTVLDKNKKSLGYRLNSQGFFNVDPNEIIILFADSSIAKFNLTTGEFRNSLALNKNDGTIDSDAYCAFTSADCTGTCYLNGESYRPMRNVLFRSPNVVLQVLGTEIDAGPQIVNSVFSNGACTLVNAVGITHSYQISTHYNRPAGIDFPLAVPLDFSVTLN